MRKLVAAVLLGLLAFTPATPVRAQIEKPDIVEVIEMKGQVSSGWATRLRQEAESWTDSVKALVILMDSPGGGVLATQEVYDQLGKIKIPVVVWCDNVCASGGLYIAMAASVKHFAVRDVSITGSMGVLMVGMDAHRLLDWAKLDPWVFKSGSLKDSGSGLRPMTEADRGYLQGTVDYLAERFYRIVEKGRPKMPKANLTSLKDARIVFGEQAVQMGLADAVSDQDAAIDKAKELSGSKRIFTRDELQKMAKAAEKPKTSSWGYQRDATPSWEADLHYFVTLVEELRTGRTQRVMYLMPLQF